MVTSLEDMVNPQVCPGVNESRWKWDSDTKTTTHGLTSSLQSFTVIVGSMVLKKYKFGLFERFVS